MVSRNSCYNVQFYYPFVSGDLLVQIQAIMTRGGDSRVAISEETSDRRSTSWTNPNTRKSRPRPHNDLNSTWYNRFSTAHTCGWTWQWRGQLIEAFLIRSSAQKEHLCFFIFIAIVYSSKKEKECFVLLFKKLATHYCNHNLFLLAFTCFSKMPQRAALTAVETANFAKMMQQKTHFEPPLEAVVPISNATMSTIDEFMEAFSDLDSNTFERGRKGCLTRGACRRRRTVENNDSRAVQFSTVEVHLHEMKLGDNPSVLMGPPLTICWYGFSHETYSVEEFEQMRGHPKRRHQMIWNRDKREELLMHSGYSRKEIDKAAATVLEINRQRMESTKDFKKKKSALRKFLDVFKKPSEPRKVDHMQLRKV